MKQCLSAVISGVVAAGFLGLFLTSLGAAENLVLELRNGDRVTGLLVAETAADLVLSNAWSQALTVAKAGILNRTVMPDAAATNRMPDVAGPLPVEPATNRTAVHSTNWHGDLQAGMNLHQGERDNQLYYARLKLEYVTRRLHNSTDLSVEYGKTDGIASAQRVEGSWKTEYDLRTRLYAYNYFNGASDRVRRMDLRYQDGPGFGYHVFARTNLALSFEAGANYEAEYHADRTAEDGFNMRLGENFTWRLAPRFALDQKVEFYPEFRVLDDFRLRAEVTLKYLLTGRLTLNLTALDQYDRTPVQGVQPNDLQMRSAIGWTF